MFLLGIKRPDHPCKPACSVQWHHRVESFVPNPIDRQNASGASPSPAVPPQPVHTSDNQVDFPLSAAGPPSFRRPIIHHHILPDGVYPYIPTYRWRHRQLWPLMVYCPYILHIGGATVRNQTSSPWWPISILPGALTQTRYQIHLNGFKTTFSGV